MKNSKKCKICGKPLRYEWEIELEICEDCQIKITKKDENKELGKI
jgi:ribosome-binding protein aMBF1 (putative translation factor)